MSKKRPKTRTEFRKKHDQRTREGDLTRRFREDESQLEDKALSERVSGKGELTRKRTVVGVEGEEAESTGLGVLREAGEAWRSGRVLSVHGRTNRVIDESGEIWTCTTSGVLRSLSTEQRHVVAAGDRVMFRPQGTLEGVIERIEPRRGVISRTSRGAQHVIVANVEQLLIVVSAAEPTLKPNLIDRLLVTAEKSRIRPVICINKVDLVSLADLQPICGVYGQLGYQVLLLAATTGFGVERLREIVRGRQSVVVGQSGVGKSSLLNAIEPGLHLRVREVSAENQKGRHTTTAAQLIPLREGGLLVDTPGIRQFQLWDVISQEVAGYFRDLRPFVSRCRYANCTHTHELDCAVQEAVALFRLDARRYESYRHLHAGE